MRISSVAATCGALAISFAGSASALSNTFEFKARVTNVTPSFDVYDFDSSGNPIGAVEYGRLGNPGVGDVLDGSIHIGDNGDTCLIGGISCDSQFDVEPAASPLPDPVSFSFVDPFESDYSFDVTFSGAGGSALYQEILAVAPLYPDESNDYSVAFDLFNVESSVDDGDGSGGGSPSPVPLPPSLALMLPAVLLLARKKKPTA